MTFEYVMSMELASKSSFVLFISSRRPPRSTRTDTLARHDALPSCSGSLDAQAVGTDFVGQTARGAVGTVRGSASTATDTRSDEHTSELQSLMRTSYAVFCLKKKNPNISNHQTGHNQILNTIPTKPLDLQHHATPHTLAYNIQ